MAHYRRNRTASVWSLSLLVVLLMLLQPAAARGDAAGPAPQYDPDSAAGKEYALPLAQARKQAQPEQTRLDGRAPSQTVGGTPLFGEGIRPAKKGFSDAPTQRRRSGPSQETNPGGAHAPPDGDRTGASSNAAPAAQPATRSTGPSGALVGLLSGGAVLLVAALITFLAKRRLSSTPATEAPG